MTAGPACGNNDSDADGVADGEAATVQEPEDIEVIEGLVSHIDEDDVVYDSPKWLETFREMKQAALDPLYKDGGDYPKECMVLRFNLHMLMMKVKALVWFWIIDETLVLTSILSVCRLNEVGTCQVMEQELIMVMMVMTTR